MSTTKRQAKKGGEIGANGEFYKGGSFIAESAETIKGKITGKKYGVRSVEIAPFKYVKIEKDSPLIGLYSCLAGVHGNSAGYKVNEKYLQSFGLHGAELAVAISEIEADIDALQKGATFKDKSGNYYDEDQLQITYI